MTVINISMGTEDNAPLIVDVDGQITVIPFEDAGSAMDEIARFQNLSITEIANIFSKGGTISYDRK